MAGHKLFSKSMVQIGFVSFSGGVDKAAALADARKKGYAILLVSGGAELYR